MSISEVTSSSDSNNKVRVIGRIRPLAKYEIQNGSNAVVTKVPGQVGFSDTLHIEEEGENGSGSSDKNRWFELDAVLDEHSTQKDVYENSGASKAISIDLFLGYNATIIAYGQTGSGKTYTMGTASSSNDNNDDDDENDGVIPRACRDLFNCIREKCDGNATVECSYMEVYKEEIRDLLVETKGSNNTKNSYASKQKQLRIRETLDGQIYVRGLTEREVKSPLDICKIMEEANKRRVVASTKMNATSSRSHAICVLKIKGVVVFTNDNNNNNNHNDDDDGVSKKFEAKLTLVDLAGSERLKKTEAKGSRAKEGISINKGLFVLGQVVSALAERGRILNEMQQRKKGANGNNKRQVIPPRRPPYRDSKLTRLLQDSLGGNSRTLMIACVSPANYNIEETVNTLRYATQARNISNTATANLVETISQDEARKLKRENTILKNQISELDAFIATLTQDVTPNDLERSISMIQQAQQTNNQLLIGTADDALTRRRNRTLTFIADNDEDLHDSTSTANELENHPLEDGSSTHGVDFFDDKEIENQDNTTNDDMDRDTDFISNSTNLKTKKKANAMNLNDHPERSSYNTSNNEGKDDNRDGVDDNDNDKDSVSLLVDNIFENRSLSGGGVTQSIKRKEGKYYRTNSDNSMKITRTIEELEDKNVEFEARLMLAERDVKATIRSSAQLPALKKRVAQLEESLNETKWLENATWELQYQLEEAKADKESAQQAAQQLTGFMNQQKKETGFSGNELSMEQVIYFRHKLNEDWVRFIVVVLNSFKEEMRLLGDYFQIVVQVVESPDILGMLGILNNKERQETINNAGVGWWKNKELKEKELQAAAAEKKLRNELLQEHIHFFYDRLVDIEDEVNFRSESIDVVLEGLNNERNVLGADFESDEDLDSTRDVFSMKGEKLLKQLGALMTGKLFNKVLKPPPQASDTSNCNDEMSQNNTVEKSQSSN